MKFELGQIFKRIGSEDTAEVIKVYGKTADVLLSSGRVVSKQKLQPFLLSYVLTD